MVYQARFRRASSGTPFTFTSTYHYLFAYQPFLPAGRIIADRPFNVDSISRAAMGDSAVLEVSFCFGDQQVEGRRVGCQLGLAKRENAKVIIDP